MTNQASPLQLARAAYQPKLPKVLAEQGPNVLASEGAPTTSVADSESNPATVSKHVRPANRDVSSRPRASRQGPVRRRHPFGRSGAGRPQCHRRPLRRAEEAEPAMRSTGIVAAQVGSPTTSTSSSTTYSLTPIAIRAGSTSSDRGAPSSKRKNSSRRSWTIAARSASPALSSSAATTATRMPACWPSTAPRTRRVSK